MSDAFKTLAAGNFANGIERLQRDEGWSDANDSLDGPFLLAFPGKNGWGEGLLVASLLKRIAVDSGRRIPVACNDQIRSILKDDESFVVGSVEELRPRSPLAVLQHALLGTLLELPFRSVTTTATGKQKRERPRFGVAWASMDNGHPIPNKSVPVSAFGQMLCAFDAEFISFQRQAGEHDQHELRDYLGNACAFLSDDNLDAVDQSETVGEIAALDCMVTVSTTTAHIAACMGVPVILLVARRNGPQWFWRAQEEHGKCFYPSVDIHFGDRVGPNWFDGAIKTASLALAKRLARA